MTPGSGPQMPSASSQGVWSAVSRRAAIPDRSALHWGWLIRLRWAQLAGQAATIAGSAWIGVTVPWVPLLALVGVGVSANVVLLTLRAPSDGHLAAVMALDVALLTAMLYLTGGPLNPFGSLYLVQIALATVILPPAWAWALGLLSFGGFGALLIKHRDLVVPDTTRMIGGWVGLGVAAAFIVYFLWRITAALSQRDRELAESRHLTARQERLASLATMAAGAAHELSTPLSTVALVAKELERNLTMKQPELAEDARLIRAEVGRCRVILDQMAIGTSTVGESVQELTVAKVLQEAVDGTRAKPAVVQHIAAEVAAVKVRVPPRAIGQALRSIVTNAQDASAETPVELAATVSGSSLRLEVRDRGVGIAAEVLARLGEPFFTTKPPGQGMGLGLFLARAVIEGVGGNLEIRSRLGQGTTVAVTLPLDVAQGGAKTAEAVL